MFDRHDCGVSLGRRFRNACGYPHPILPIRSFVPVRYRCVIRKQQANGHRACRCHLSLRWPWKRRLPFVGSSNYLSIVSTLTFLVGAVLLMFGALRVGGLFERVLYSLVVEFTAGVGPF